MSDLIAFLRAALDDDERVAREASGRRWKREAISCVVDAADDRLVVYGEGTPTPEQADHIARWDPARVLADIDAKRQIIDWAEAAQREFDRAGLSGRDSTPMMFVEWLALPFVDREGYRSEWRP